MVTLWQEWPTSEMLRATFLSVFQQRAIPYTTDNDRINRIVPLIDTRFCLARLVAYRPVSSDINDIVIGASDLGFVAWAGQSGQCRHRCDVSSNSKLCCPKFVSYTYVGVAQAQSRGNNSSDGRVVRISASGAADSGETNDFKIGFHNFPD